MRVWLLAKEQGLQVGRLFEKPILVDVAGWRLLEDVGSLYFFLFLQIYEYIIKVDVLIILAD